MKRILVLAVVVCVFWLVCHAIGYHPDLFTSCLAGWVLGDLSVYVSDRFLK